MHYKLQGDKQLSKKDEVVVKMKEEIDKLYVDGRTTVMGDEELEKLYESLTGKKRRSTNWYDL